MDAVIRRELDHVAIISFAADPFLEQPLTNNIDEAIDITLHSDTVVYAIGVGDSSMADGVNKSTLSKIALRTGGQFFSPRKNEDLTDAFERIANELRNQYLLSYVPLNRNAEPSYRRLRIEIGDTKSQRHRPRLFYRPGYYFRQQTAKL